MKRFLQFLFFISILAYHFSLSASSVDTTGTVIFTHIEEEVCEEEAPGPNEPTITLDTIISNGICTIQTTEIIVLEVLGTIFEMQCVPEDPMNIEGRFFQTLLDSNGCEYTLVTDVFFEPLDQFLEATLCEGEILLSCNEMIDSSGIYEIEKFDMGPCPYTLTLDLTFLEMVRDTTSMLICEGDTINWNYMVLTEPGFYTSKLTGANGCTLFQSLILEEGNDSRITGDTIVCGTSLMYGDQLIEESGIYDLYYIGSEICVDSITLTVELVEETEVFETVCGDRNSIPGIFTLTVGCETMIMEVLPFVHDNFLIEEICEGDTLLWNGQAYTESTIISVEKINGNGCTYMDHLDLTVIPEVECISSTDDLSNGAFTLYPNPTSNAVEIQLEDSSLDKAQMRLISINGELLLDKQLTENSNHLDLSFLPQGLYLCQVKVDQVIYTRLLTKI